MDDIGEFAAGLLQDSDIGIVEAPAGPDAIQEHPDLNASPGGIGQGVPKLTADWVGIEDVSLEVNGFARGPDRFEHGREVCVTVEHRDFVPGDQGRIGQTKAEADELRIMNRKGVLEVVGEGVPPNNEQAEKENGNEEEESKADRFANGEFPKPVVQPVSGRGWP